MCKPSLMKIINYDSVNSTMDTAVKLIQEGLEEPFIVSAKQQINGRGRKKNRWFSPLGGLYLTLVFPYEESISKDHIVMYHYTTALAICSALKTLYNVDASVKWPNDIIIEKKKVGGILIEYISNGKEFLLLGIGINVNISQKLFPKDLREKSISLKAFLEKSLELNELTKTLEERVISFNSFVIKNQFEKIIHLYNELCIYYSKQIILEDETKYICRGLDSTGKLILENPSVTKLLDISEANTIKSVI